MAGGYADADGKVRNQYCSITSSVLGRYANKTAPACGGKERENLRKNGSPSRIFYLSGFDGDNPWAGGPHCYAAVFTDAAEMTADRFSGLFSVNSKKGELYVYRY